MSTRFRVDLLHPGGDLRQMGWVAQSWAEWFTSPDAPRRLALFSLSCAAVLVVILVAVILPPYWRLSSDLNAVPGLRRDAAARQTDHRRCLGRLRRWARPAVARPQHERLHLVPLVRRADSPARARGVAVRGTARHRPRDLGEALCRRRPEG